MRSLALLNSDRSTQLPALQTLSLSVGSIRRAARASFAIASALVCLDRNRLLEAVAVDQVVQGGTAYPEQFGSGKDVPIDPAQCLDDRFTLGLIAHFA